MTVPQGVKVAADCARCGTHVDETALPGRVTWRGPCPSCGQQVIARRVPSAPPPTAPPKARQGPRRARKVAGYAQSTGSAGGRRPGGAPRLPAAGGPTPPGGARPGEPEPEHPEPDPSDVIDDPPEPPRTDGARRADAFGLIEDIY